MKTSTSILLGVAGLGLAVGYLLTRPVLYPAAGDTADTRKLSQKALPDRPGPAAWSVARSNEAPFSAIAEEKPDGWGCDASVASWASELRALRELAAVDPDAALARVAQMADKHERKAAAAEACLVIAEGHPEKAMRAAWELELGRFADDATEVVALERLALHWAEADLVAMLRWTSTLAGDDESRRDRVVKGLVAAVARRSPPTAAALVADEISPEGSMQIEAALEVLRRWAGRDFPAALGWASLFPEGPLRDRAIDELVELGAIDRGTASREPSG